MRRGLLDVNVLLALLDRDHVGHDTARRWLEENIDAGWASCAITQNGFVRVVSQPRYPHHIATSAAVSLLSGAVGGEHHEGWPCDLQVTDPRTLERSRLLGPRQVTDAYLLALAVRHGGRLVTFDESVPTSAVVGATPEHLTVLR